MGEARRKMAAIGSRRKRFMHLLELISHARGGRKYSFRKIMGFADRRGIR